MPWVNCRVCHRRFYAKPRHLRIGWGKYCSNRCKHANQLSGRLVTCANCGQAIYRSLRALSNSVSGNYFCSKACHRSWENQHRLGILHPQWKTGRSVYRNMLRASGVPMRCKRCGLADERLLTVHHLDMDRENNNLDNLAWLCANCHYLVHHYKEPVQKT
jgi:hypothetical protein